jgi:hypothetical protein
LLQTPGGDVAKLRSRASVRAILPGIMVCAGRRAKDKMAVQQNATTICNNACDSDPSVNLSKRFKK